MKRAQTSTVLCIIIFLLFTKMSRAKVLDYYVPEEGQLTQGVFFPYYASETGVSIGHFYYNTDFLNKNGKLNNVLLYSPETGIGVDWFELEDLELNEKWHLGANLFWGGANDFRLYQNGNDSSNEEISYLNQDGYQKGNAIQLNTKLKISRILTEKNRINFIYSYDYTNVDLDDIIFYISESNTATVKGQELTGKIDKLQLEFERRTIKNKADPKKGYRVILGVEKSLNLLSHDSDNDWDYYKLRNDFRAYIPVKKSVFALRFYTVEFEYLKNVSEAEDVYNFDTAKLGTLNEFRGYFIMRYKDRNLALYQSEYRFPINKKGNIKGTIFYELGRVNDEFNSDLFLKDLHSDAGFGLDYYFNDYILLRADIAFSSELTQLRASVGHAF